MSNENHGASQSSMVDKVETPVEHHDLEKETHDEFWDKECVYQPDRPECRVYEN